ncbi:MAG: ABC transporter permease [Anaerolineae bacterium]|nr:ABC transporter permease [Anaerolineae bacterium]
MKRGSFWSWFWVSLGWLYFILPLLGTFLFSLRARKDTLSFLAYENVFKDPRFWDTFSFSALMATLTIVVSVLLIVPTAYWVQLRLPHLRPIIELMTLMPFVIPTIVLVFGLIRVFSRPPLALTGNTFTTNILLIAGYTVLSFPYMYRAVDTGLRAIDVRTLTEAAQSLGAGWPTILFQVIFPNVRVALLSGAFLTFAIVMGEYVLATFLARPAFAPYLVLLGQARAYEPAALAIISFALTWVCIGLIQFIGRGQESSLAGTH